jgi:hypothetical protein
MVLSCCDLLAVLANSPFLALVTMLWLTGKLDVNARWAYISLTSTSSFFAFSLFALLVMNFDRYLATSYPIFHRTSVTKGRLLTLLAILIIVDVILKVMSVNDFAQFLSRAWCNFFHSFHSSNVIYQLQTAPSREEKS